MPASTLAVVLTTEHDAGVSEVAVTVEASETGTFIKERIADVSSELNLVNSPKSLAASPLL
jgi:hypothetical protein